MKISIKDIYLDMSRDHSSFADVTPLPLDHLLALGRYHFENKHLVRWDDRLDRPGYLKRQCLNYVRHEVVRWNGLTYDDMLPLLDRKGKQKLKEKFAAAVKKAWPELSAAADAFLKDREGGKNRFTPTVPSNS
jgi:hypothetical protein